LDFAGSAAKIKERRLCAARLIGELGTNGASAIPMLMKIWNDPNDDWGVRYSILQAMAEMDNRVSGYLPNFVDAAKSTNSDLRDAGITLISHCGPKGRPAIPLLRDFIDHGGPTLAGEAAEALWNVDRQTNVACKVFSGLLTNSATWYLGIKYLSEMGPAASPAIPALMPRLADTNRIVRLEAEALIRMLDPVVLAPISAQIKSNTVENISNLIVDLQSGTAAKVANFPPTFPGANVATHEDTLRAIKMYGPDARLTVPALIELIKRGNRYDPLYAVEALTQIGPAASPAVAALIAMRQKEEFAPIRCLGRIGPAAKDALPFLGRELKSEVPDVRWAAADSIIRIAPQNASNVISVLHGLERLPLLAVYADNFKFGDAPIAWRPNPSSNYWRLAAEISLSRLRLEEKPSVSEIVAGMEHRKPMGMQAEQWIELLGDLGPDAKAALPALEKRLSPLIWGQREVAIAIRSIDPREADRLNLPGLLALP
jgi:hypothetical protein